MFNDTEEDGKAKITDAVSRSLISSFLPASFWFDREAAR
jgi:hypothetical protein